MRRLHIGIIFHQVHLNIAKANCSIDRNLEAKNHYGRSRKCICEDNVYARTFFFESKKSINIRPRLM